MTTTRAGLFRLGTVLAFPILLTLPARAQGLKETTRKPLFDHGLSGGAPRESGNVHRALPDTVRVLAVMVEFQSDDDPRTSGTGKFGTVFTYDYGGEIIDPYPHDRAYFQAHLRFLENYVAKASSGRTAVRSHVLEKVVTVPKRIRDYSYRKGESAKPVAELAFDAWTAADSTMPETDFSQWDMFIVFHAGRGRDVDMASYEGVDPTPFDIPSLSFRLEEFRKHFGAEFNGIPVEGGTFRITNTSIMPCTETREISLITGQKALWELSINGLLAASFGTYAGLPDLFDTKRGRTGIGRFGLMDTESIFAFNGICPPAPSAWEKRFLGWAVPREAEAGKRTYSITASRTDQPSTPDLLRVPVTGTEYWLLENRQRDPGGNGQRIVMRVGGQDVELRFPKDTTGFNETDVSALKGVVVDVEDLDWSLPGGRVISGGKEVRVGGGILIWHIDETVIEAGMADNTVNADPKRRGVDLEQAAGPQDIGETIASIFGSEIGKGTPLDYWFSGNISPLYENRFGATTAPDTRANNGAHTHVTMDNFDVPGPVMSVDIALGDEAFSLEPGWPVDLKPHFTGETDGFSVETYDIDGDGGEEIFAAAGCHADGDTVRVFGFHRDASPLIPRAGTALVAEVPGMRSVLRGPLVGRVTAHDHPVLVVPCTDGTELALVVFSTTDGDGDKRFDGLGRIDLPLSAVRNARSSWFMLVRDLVYLTTGPSGDTLHCPARDMHIPLEGENTSLAFLGDSAVFLENGAVVDLADGRVRYPARRSTAASGRSGNCITADIDGDGHSEGVSLNGSLTAVLAGQGTADASGCPMIPIRSASPALAGADADGDGRCDILIADSASVHAVNAAFSSTDHYPTNVPARYTLAARLAGDTRDALFVVGEGLLSQLRTGAVQAEGFPVPLPAEASVVLLPLREDDASVLGIAVAGADGMVYLFRTRNVIHDVGLMWRGRDGDSRHTNRAEHSGAVPFTRNVFFPAERCYNWPNPVYDAVTKIRFYVSTDADVTVNIYDQSGVRVARLAARAMGGLDNEVDWDVSSVESGVYLGHVKAVGAGGSGEKIIKIAVVK
ncbi:MAG: hypothetical protein QHI48_02395 [Bacteroidota bacterium]|nr:hypothetical protein [Bacteroidota bacterium]